jgi:WhiB family redox-sensing transcriptional regulator
VLQSSPSFPHLEGERVDDQNWRQFAACRGMVTDLFFPAGDVAAEPVAQAEHAKAICRHCHVRRECLEYALATNEQYGIWGGLTEAERRALRRKRRRQAS